MGFHICYICVKGLTKAQLLARIGMSATREEDEATEAPFSLAQGPKGWLILWANDFDYASEAVLRGLSAAATAVGCQVHEGIMVSVAREYRDAREVWTVMHDSSRGGLHLAVQGTPPPQFTAIRDRLLAAQAAEPKGEPLPVDSVFDIPVETARALTGYRYDESRFDWGEPKFYVLKPARGGAQKFGALGWPGPHPRPIV